MTKHAIIVFFASLLVVAAFQEHQPGTTTLTPTLTTLQSDMDKWQMELASLHFEELTQDQNWIFNLNQQRSQCLGAMKFASEQITAAELSSKNELPLTAENALEGSLGRLQDRLWNLAQFVQVAFGAAPRPTRVGSSEAPVVNKWMHESAVLFGMSKAISRANGLVGYDLRQRLDAIDDAAPPSQSTPHSLKSRLSRLNPMSRHSAEIAGRISRTDNGSPIADAIVTLTSSPSLKNWSQRTATDGRYKFSGLAGGYYRLSAYRKGFVLASYQGGSAAEVGMCPPSCLMLTEGQKVANIDLRLDADPNISQMPEEAFAALDAGKPLSLTYDAARFSPDGKLLAINVHAQGLAGGIWFYDMNSHKLTPAVDDAGKLLTFGVQDWSWASDGTLYLSGLLWHGGVGHKAYAAVASTGDAKQIANVPPEIAKIFEEDEAFEPADKLDLSGLDEVVYSSQYIVMSERMCRGCPNTLSGRPRSGGAARFIAEIDRNFAFDADSSVVFYPTLRFPWPTGSIVLFDLNKWKAREIPVPVMAESLLDVTRVGESYLLAYTAADACTPEDSSEEAVARRFAPGYVAPSNQTHLRHVCFVTLP